VQIEQAERSYDLNTAARLKYDRLEAVQHDRELQEAKFLEIQSRGASLLREEVIEADIAELWPDGRAFQSTVYWSRSGRSSCNWKLIWVSEWSVSMRLWRPSLLPSAALDRA
jgi:hypothetical protein